MSTATSPEGMAWQNAYLKLRNSRERADVAAVSADTVRLWRIFRRFHEDRVRVARTATRLILDVARPPGGSASPFRMKRGAQ